MDALWTAVETNWAEIIQAFHSHNEHMMYDEEGNLVESNRPLIESMVDDKIHRRGTFWFYMEMLMHDSSIIRDGHDIYVSCGTPLPLAGGGAEEYVEREVVNDGDRERVLQHDGRSPERDPEGGAIETTPVDL